MCVCSFCFFHSCHISLCNRKDLYTQKSRFSAIKLVLDHPKLPPCEAKSTSWQLVSADNLEASRQPVDDSNGTTRRQKGALTKADYMPVSYRAGATSETCATLIQQRLAEHFTGDALDSHQLFAPKAVSELHSAPQQARQHHPQSRAYLLGYCRACQTRETPRP